MKILFLCMLCALCACLTHDEFCAEPAQFHIFGYELATLEEESARPFWPPRLFLAKGVRGMCAPLPTFVRPLDPVHTLVGLIGYLALDSVNAFASALDSSYNATKHVDAPKLVLTGVGWFMFDFIDAGRMLAIFVWTRPFAFLGMVAMFPLYFVTVIPFALCLYSLRFLNVARIQYNVPAWNMVLATAEMLFLTALCGVPCAGCLALMCYITS